MSSVIFQRRGMHMQADVIVIGAGMAGAAIAYGLAGRGLRVLVLDGSDADHRAARANFGLVWLPGEGTAMPEYQHLTWRSVDLWPELHDRLTRLVGGRIDYERNGGLAFRLGGAAVGLLRRPVPTQARNSWRTRHTRARASRRMIEGPNGHAS